jgi:glutamine cyclotransferase
MRGWSRLAEAGAALAAVAALALLVAAPGGRAAEPGVPVFGYRVVGTWPHDPKAFTEGLALDGGVLYESTGRNGASEVRKVDLRTGRVLRRARLPKRYYGEGATVLGGRVYQLTWTQGTAFVYDRDTLRRIRTGAYAGEAWGVTGDGSRLAVSDGSAVVRFLDPSTFAVRRRVTVRDEHGDPLTGLNELELVGREICANVFTTDRIACFDPASGRLRYWIDIAELLPPELRPGDEDAVANGIAYGGRPGRLVITGKLWPRAFEIRLVPKA